jgi:hypothetical protein
MSPEEIQKLLGGYATDTLSAAERSALFAAALEDQELFDALAKEHALREVLEDPASRQQLIAALGPSRDTLAARAWRWLRRPASLAMAGSLAALLMVGGFLLRRTNQTKPTETLMADAIATQPAAPLNAIKPLLAEPKLKNPEAKKSVRLPSPPPLPAQSTPRDAAQSMLSSANLPVAQAAPSAGSLVTPPAALPAAPQAPRPAAGGVGGARPLESTELGRIVQAAPAPARAFSAGAHALARAKSSGALVIKPPVAYTLLLEDGPGAYSPAPPGAVFHPGNSVRLRIKPPDAGFLYLLRHETSPQAPVPWTLIESAPVEKGQPCVLPSIGGLQSDLPARMELLLVFSRAEQLDSATPASNAQALSELTIEFR